MMWGVKRSEAMARNKVGESARDAPHFDEEASVLAVPDEN